MPKHNLLSLWWNVYFIRNIFILYIWLFFIFLPTGLQQLLHVLYNFVVIKFSRVSCKSKSQVCIAWIVNNLIWVKVWQNRSQDVIVCNCGKSIAVTNKKSCQGCHLKWNKNDCVSRALYIVTFFLTPDSGHSREVLIGRNVPCFLLHQSQTCETHQEWDDCVHSGRASLRKLRQEDDQGKMKSWRHWSARAAAFGKKCQHKCFPWLGSHHHTIHGQLWRRSHGGEGTHKCLVKRLIISFLHHEMVKKYYVLPNCSWAIWAISSACSDRSQTELKQLPMKTGGASKKPALIFSLYSGISDKRTKYCVVPWEYPTKNKSSAPVVSRT